MKIGITERGDASINTIWYPRLITQNNEFDGVILITKHITVDFIDRVMRLHKADRKLIIHATCTGWGKSVIEPNVPDFKTQLEMLNMLVSMGFPLKQCVLRIDPIIPTDQGLQVVKSVIDYAEKSGILTEARIRVSVLDEYRHVKERLRALGYKSFYPDNQFQASEKQMKAIAELLASTGYQFHTCAENKLAKYAPEGVFIQSGCISKFDLDILGIPVPDDLKENPQNRYGCHCLSCKTELLMGKGQCPHKCVYCYWKEPYTK